MKTLSPTSLHTYQTSTVDWGLSQWSGPAAVTRRLWAGWESTSRWLHSNAIALQAQVACVLRCCLSPLPVCCHAPSLVSVLLQARIAELVSHGVSVRTATYTSLEHCNQMEEATDEDNQDVIASGKLDVSWPAGVLPQASMLVNVHDPRFTVSKM